MKDAVDAGKQGVTLTGKPGLESQWQGFPWFTSHGFSYGDPEAEPMADTYSMLQDWVAKGYLSKEAATWDQTVPFQQFAAGSSVFAVNGNWQIGAAKEAAFKYGVAPLPITDEGGVLLGGEVQNVGAFSKHKELAQEFLRGHLLLGRRRVDPARHVRGYPRPRRCSGRPEDRRRPDPQRLR